MSKAATNLRNSLILLALSAAASSAWAADAPPTQSQFNVPIQAADTPPTPRVLDLKAPDVRDVMTTDEMAAAIGVPDEFDVLAPDEVAVRGLPQSPYVPSGFGALYWAALHPFNAWRILAPVQ